MNTIDKYLIHLREGTYKNEDFIEQWEPYLTDIETGLDFISNFLSACENDYEIACVAAGPLEDLIHKFPKEIAEPLERLVRTNTLFRKAITAVWVSEGSAAQITVKNIIKKYGLDK